MRGRKTPLQSQRKANSKINELAYHSLLDDWANFKEQWLSNEYLATIKRPVLLESLDDIKQNKMTLPNIFNDIRLHQLMSFFNFATENASPAHDKLLISYKNGAAKVCEHLQAEKAGFKTKRALKIFQNNLNTLEITDLPDQHLELCSIASEFIQLPRGKKSLKAHTWGASMDPLLDFTDRMHDRILEAIAENPEALTAWPKNTQSAIAKIAANSLATRQQST